MSSASCPVCGINWPGRISVCPCGYAPDDLDGFRRRLQMSRRRGLVLQLVGAAMIAPLPLLALLGSGMWFVPTLASTGIAIGGFVAVVRGARQLHVSTKRLRALAQLRQLPAARVV